MSPLHETVVSRICGELIRPSLAVVSELKWKLSRSKVAPGEAHHGRLGTGGKLDEIGKNRSFVYEAPGM
ncbi:hypothetical protein, partial [Xanthomonas arboricola]|uniref:hypothetical protein n=1 Tax=Xanthomonas arboricola TaxID=56448 RepID=UPI001C611E9F